MNDRDPVKLRIADRKTKTSQATISMPNGSAQQLAQYPWRVPVRHAFAPLCSEISIDATACLIDAAFSSMRNPLRRLYGRGDLHFGILGCYFGRFLPNYPGQRAPNLFECPNFL